MIDARFEICLPPILKWEGGNDDDPNDHGGRTSRGITQREYDKWRTAKGLPTRDVWTASTDEIHDIYYEEYWLPICSHLAPGVDLMFFNIAVNGGVRRAAITLQRALSIPESSDEFKSSHEYVGPVTLKYAAQANATKLINDFDRAVVAFYRSLAQFNIYGKGWLGREADIHAVALKATPTTQPAAPAPITPKETIPMTTAVPAVQTTDPIPQIIATLESIKKFVPFIAGLPFVPPVASTAANAAIPIIEEILALIEAFESKSGVDLFQTIGQHIQAIGQHVQTATTAVSQAPAGALTNGMPNS